MHFQVMLSRNVKIFGIMASLLQIGKKCVKYTWGHRWRKLYLIIVFIFFGGTHIFLDTNSKSVRF